MIITYSIFDVLIRFFEEKFWTYTHVHESNTLYFCFKIVLPMSSLLNNT
jgi:hypothetical protein